MQVKDLGIKHDWICRRCCKAHQISNDFTMLWMVQDTLAKGIYNLLNDKTVQINLNKQETKVEPIWRNPEIRLGMLPEQNLVSTFNDSNCKIFFTSCGPESNKHDQRITNIKLFRNEYSGETWKMMYPREINEPWVNCMRNKAQYYEKASFLPWTNLLHQGLIQLSVFACCMHCDQVSWSNHQISVYEVSV